MKRVLYIDNLKAFAILLVILGHVIQRTDVDYDNNLVFRYIYSFHMPLFMFLSGFFVSEKKSIGNTVRLRARSLIIPFIVWGGVTSLLVETSLVEIILHPDKGLWFLWDLFFINIFILLCLKLARFKCWNENFVIVIGTISLFVIGIFVEDNLLNIRSMAKLFPYYTLGYFVSKYNKRITDISNRLSFLLLLIWSVTAYFFKRNGNPTFDMRFPLIGDVYTYAVGIIGVLGWYFLFKRIFDRDYLWSSLGFKTLGIYAIHFNVLDMILLLHINVELYSLYVFVLFVSTLCLTLIIYYFLRLNRITSMFFLGR